MNVRAIAGTEFPVEPTDVEAARHRAIFDSALSFAIIAIDRGGLVTDWSAGAERILGWSADEMRGQPAEHFYTPEDNAARRMQTEMRLALEASCASDDRWHLRRDGSRFWASGEMMPLRGAGNAHLGFVKILRDRTEEHRAQRALQAAETSLRVSEERYRALFSALNAGFCVVEMRFDDATDRALDYRFLEVNPAFETQTGLVDATGKWMRTLAPAHEQVWFDRYGDVARTGRTVRFEDEAVALGRHYDISAFRVGPAEAGQVAILFRDITQRRHSELALRESEARFRTFAQAVPNHVWSATPDGKLEWANEPTYAFSGRAADGTIGDSWTARVHPDDRARVGARWAASLASGETYEIEFRVQRADGVYRWFLVRALPVRDPDGAVVRWIGANADIDDQKRAEARLRESEDHFRHTVELNPQVPWTADPDGNIISYAHRWLELTGQAPGEPDGAGWVKALHPEDVPQAMAVFSASLASGEPVDVDYRIRIAASGEYRWMRARAHPRRDAQNTILRWYGIVEDVHDRKLAEARLRGSEEQFRVFAQAVPNHVWAGRPDGYLDWFNDQVYAYTGETPGTLDGPVTWTRIVHPDDLPAAGEAWGRSLATGDVYETEFRVRRADGAWRWFLVRAVPVRDAQGQIRRWVGTNTDIDDRRRQAAELARLATTLEEQVEARTAERNRLWQTTNDLMGTAGLDGYMKTANPAWQRVLGWTDEEVLSRPFAEFVDPADHTETLQVMRRLAAGETVTGFVDRVLTKTGAKRVVMWTAVPDPGTDLFHIIGRDLTEQRHAEEALRQAQKMEAVGQLTGGLAHDFNNLLTGISGSLELMEARMRQGRFGELDRYIGAAQGASKRAAALTHRLLAFSRRQTLDPKPTDVNRLVVGMEELIRRTVGPAIELEVVGAGGLWPALVDPHQLENALLNLCINARDAMPGSGRITIETANKWLDGHAARERDLDPGQYLSLCVTDTGTGMSPDVIAKAFEPFFTTKPLGEGTGLGLSMIYGFARQSGGQVRIYSEVGQGTTMCLYLPRHYGPAEEGDAPPDLAKASRADLGETVLIVDDEPTVRMLVTEVLEDLGYTAVEAGDGAAGLKILQSNVRIDLLITDVGLPGGMNGRQLADAARMGRPSLKVLFITGYAENAVVGNGHLDPGMQIMTKPFVMEALASRIKEMIAAH